MAVEMRPVPTNLMSWPKHSDLINGHKTVVFSLWANTHTSNAGVAVISSGELGQLSSNPANVIVDVLGEFERRKIILWDRETGEIFVVDWFRFHRFEGLRLPALVEDLKKIISPQISRAVDKSIATNSQLAAKINQFHTKSTTSVTREVKRSEVKKTRAVTNLDLARPGESMVEFQMRMGL